MEIREKHADRFQLLTNVTIIICFKARKVDLELIIVGTNITFHTIDKRKLRHLNHI